MKGDMSDPQRGGRDRQHMLIADMQTSLNESFLKYWTFFQLCSRAALLPLLLLLTLVSSSAIEHSHEKEQDKHKLNITANF